MCGITGFVLDEINPQAPDWLTEMTQRLYHRGPDDGGAVVFGMNATPTVERRLGRPGEKVDWSFVPAKIGLGSRRLAVLDPSPAGRQPMSSPDGRVWLVYNGELYNHAALREELRAAGLSFTGHGDTEVFFAAYRHWGCACFERFEGMWAAAIIDWAAGRLVLSRDRLGIKPLYVSRFDGGMAFASEIKSLHVLPGAAQGVNEARLRDFLCDGRVDHTDQTLFESIWPAPPGCHVELDLRARGAIHAGGSVNKYWRSRMDWIDPTDAAEEIRNLLSDSVRAHLQSDVPIGSCLSGGLDSSAIVALAHQAREQGSSAAAHLTQHTFTASLPGDALDESGYARMVVESLSGLEGHVTLPSAERLLADFSTLMWHQEEPFGSPSIYMQWEVMRLARQTGVTVLLDGQGGDELFCGYEGYLPWYVAHLLRRGRLPAAVAEFRAARSMHFSSGGLLRHVVADLLPEAARRRWRLRHLLGEQPWLVGELFAAEESPGLCEALDVRPAGELELEDAPRFARRCWRVLLRDSLPSLLRFEDRSSMAFSIEARVPFLHRPVVELAMRLRPELKIRRGGLKHVLREATRGLVPEAVLNRRDKIGFSAPTAKWLRGGLRDWWQESLTSKSFLERGCFAPKGVLQLIQRFDAGDDAAAGPIWRLALTEQWARQFLDR